MPGPGSSQKNPLFPQVGDEEEEDLPSTTLPDGSTGLGDTTRSHSPPSARDMTASARGVRPPFGGSTVRASNGGVEILVGSTRNSMTARLSEEPVHIGSEPPALPSAPKPLPLKPELRKTGSKSKIGMGDLAMAMSKAVITKPSEAYKQDADTDVPLVSPRDDVYVAPPEDRARPLAPLPPITATSFLRTTMNDLKKHMQTSMKRSSLSGPSGGSVAAPTPKHVFTVSKDEMSQLRENAAKKLAKTNWGRSKAVASVKLDTETLVDTYVELVCNDLRTERKNDNQIQRRYIFDPQENRRIQWDFVVLSVIAIIAIVIPYRACFGHDANYFSMVREAFVDSVLFLDILVRFRTAYCESDGVMQVQPKKIAARYAFRGWLLVDVISALPLEYHPLTRPYAPLRLVKLLQFFTFTNSVAESKTVAILISPTVFRLTLTVAILFWVWHVIGCGYWYISTLQGLGTTAWTPSIEHADKGNVFNYMDCIVWTLQATFSCSPGAPPETHLEAAFSILAILLGIFMNATVIGSANSTLQSLDSTNAAKRQRMERVVEYMKRRNLPSYFQRIILDFYQYVSDKTTDEGILLDLPAAIQGRLQLLLNRELVKTIPLLKSLELSTIISLMQTLQHRMVMPGEFIFKAGDKGERLFFVKKGQLELLLPEQLVKADAATNSCGSLRTGDLMGMVALTANQPHEFSARALVYSEVLYLEKDVYEELSKESDKFQELIEMEAIKQENLISQAKKSLGRSSHINTGGEEGSTSPTPGRANVVLRKKALAVGKLMRNLKPRASVASPPPVAKRSSKVTPADDDDDDEDRHSAATPTEHSV